MQLYAYLSILFVSVSMEVRILEHPKYVRIINVAHKINAELGPALKRPIRYVN